MIITHGAALFLVTLFGAVMFVSGAVPGKKANLEKFMVSGRSVGTFTGALSAAATWIWAPALFLAAQKAFQQGLAGLMWFTVPNVGSLILFGFLASRIRRLFPKGYTLPQYIAERFDAKNHILYLFTFLALQICSLGVQLIAGATLLNAMGGISYATGVMVLAVIFTSYSLMGGLGSSIRTDLLQMIIIIAGMALLVPMAVQKGGGFQALADGFGGLGGKFGNPFDPHVAYTFGITVTIGLMSGPVGDQQHWQRAFAFKEGKVFKGYLLGAFIFALVPLTMSALGFLAAGNPDAAPLVAAGTESAQQVGPEVIRTLLPPWASVIFLIMILSGLASTGDSALCAGGSLISMDLYKKYLRPRASEKQILAMARFSILAISLLAIAIALIPGITILGLFLFYGTLRSSTLMPTIIILFQNRVPSWGLFSGIFGAIFFGLPVYLCGEFMGNIHLKVWANIGIVLISLILPLLSIYLSRKEVL